MLVLELHVQCTVALCSVTYGGSADTYMPAMCFIPWYLEVRTGAQRSTSVQSSDDLWDMTIAQSG